MPAVSFGSSPAKNLGFASSTELSLPPELSFPANTIVPYYGDDPGLVGWTKYTGFTTGQALMYGSPDFTSLGTGINVVAPSLNFSGSVSSSGAHSGSNTYQRLYSTGTIYANNASGGSHTHLVQNGTKNPNNPALGIYNRQSVTFLISTVSRSTIPTKSLVISQNQVQDSEAFTQPESTFLVQSVSGQTPYVAKANASITFTQSPSLAMAGAHTHGGTTTHRLIPSGQRFYAYYLGSNNGSHTHTVGASTFTQTQIQHKLVNLWKLTANSRARNGMIVMYIGLPQNLPSTWVLCNGLNGTPNLGNYIIGYSDGTKWDTVVAQDSTHTSIGVIPSVYLSHSHTDSGYYPVDLAASSYSGIISNGQHTNYGWNHTHTNNIAISRTAYVPYRHRIAFIQYKG